jgi:hypothetical protein
MGCLSWTFAAAFVIGSTAVGCLSTCQARDIADYTDLDLGKHGIELVKPRKDPKSGFVVGGINDTGSLRTLSELAGRRIADLERDMRPGAPVKGGSDAGFLGPDESLLEVLVTDNEFVVDQKKLTHQGIAKHLHALGVIASLSSGREFLYHGRHFRTEYFPSRGYQFSPFNDGTKTNADASVTNVATGKQIKFSLLVPYMIERYGFYEGQGTPYRVDPKQVLEVLDFLEPAAKTTCE